MISPLADTTTSAATGATSSSSSSSGSGKVSATDQQDRFLKLLVTQMKNQDPLNPMDNAQLTTQLAQISTVSGIDNLNETMKTLIGQIQGSQALQSNSMIGRDVLVTGDQLQLSSGQAIGAVEVPEGADDATVSVRSANGGLIAQIPLGKLESGMHKFAWDGQTSVGTKAADGAYKFTVEARTGNTTTAANGFAVGHVQGVIKGANGVQLDLGRLGARAIDDIKEIL